MRSFLTGDSLVYLKCLEGLIEDKLVCVEFNIGAAEDADQRRLQNGQSIEQQTDTDVYVDDRQMERLGSTSLMSNLGVFLVYGAGMILTGILIAACKPCTAGKNTRISKVILKLRKVFIWNGFFRFIIQGSLKMQLACGTIIAIYYNQDN
jgi:hypothetical protein